MSPKPPQPMKPLMFEDRRCNPVLYQPLGYMSSWLKTSALLVISAKAIDWPSMIVAPSGEPTATVMVYRLL